MLARIKSVSYTYHKYLEILEIKVSKMNEIKDLLSRIALNPEVMVGKPVVKGTRITVEHVLSLLIEGISQDEILKDYKNLKSEDILACIAFAKETLNNSSFIPLNY